MIAAHVRTNELRCICWNYILDIASSFAEMCVVRFLARPAP
jgi:hypothetical protein